MGPTTAMTLGIHSDTSTSWIHVQGPRLLHDDNESITLCAQSVVICAWCDKTLHVANDNCT